MKGFDNIDITYTMIFIPSTFTFTSSEKMQEKKWIALFFCGGGLSDFFNAYFNLPVPRNGQIKLVLFFKFKVNSMGFLKFAAMGPCKKFQSISSLIRFFSII